jgi:hypothetical protein
MVMVNRGPIDMRYRLLETLRQFGLQQLDSRGESTRVRDLHAAYYAGLAADLDVLVRGARQLEGEAHMALEWDNIRASQVWSFEHGDLESTERIADATFQYAAFSMRHENAVMLERAVQLGDECGRPSTNMLGLLSYWADMQGDQVEGRRLAQRGLDVAPSPDHGSTASCWWMLSGASSADVLTPSDARAAFQKQAAAVANTANLEHDWLALVCLADASLNADFGSMPKVLEQLRDLAGRVQCPRLALSLHEHEGHAYLRATPPDFAAATIAYGQFAAISEATGDRQSSARALRCLAMASTGLGAPDALTRCHDALERLYDIRHWQKVWQTAESVALALAQAGRVDEAAAILGHLGVRPRGSGMEHGLHFGDRARELVNARGDCSDAMTRGARMSVDEFIVAALAYCAEV